MTLNFHKFFVRGSLKPLLLAQLAVQQEELIVQNPAFQHARDEFLRMSGAEVPRLLRLIMDLETGKNRVVDQHLALFDNEDAVKFRLVRLANGLSAPAGVSRHSISDSRAAMEKIGFSAVREIAAAAAVSKLLKFDGVWQSSSDEDFWRHSVATAIASRRLYHHLFGVPSFGLLPYLTGLFHDIGIVAAAAHRTLGAGVEYRQTLLLHLQHQLPLNREEEALLGFSHADLGAAVLDEWKLPREVGEAVRHHHRTPAGGGAGTAAARLVHTLRIADDMARRLQGAGQGHFMAPAETLLEESFRFLELPPAEWATLMADVTGEWEMLSRLGWFQLLCPRYCPVSQSA